MARIWDTTTGEPLLPPLRHLAKVPLAVFDGTGARVLTASWDGTARLWHVLSDEDLPADLAVLETEVWTGETEGVAIPEVHARKWALWEDKAAEHARRCRFPDANLWLRRGRGAGT